MIPDLARGRVLEYLTDEKIGSYYEGPSLEVLKTIPPEWRQNVLAEVARRCFIPRIIGNEVDFELVEGKDHYTELLIVAGEVLEQLGA